MFVFENFVIFVFFAGDSNALFRGKTTLWDGLVYHPFRIIYDITLSPHPPFKTKSPTPPGITIQHREHCIFCIFIGSLCKQTSLFTLLIFWFDLVFFFDHLIKLRSNSRFFSNPCTFLLFLLIFFFQCLLKLWSKLPIIYDSLPCFQLFVFFFLRLSFKMAHSYNFHLKVHWF